MWGCTFYRPITKCVVFSWKCMWIQLRWRSMVISSASLLRSAVQIYGLFWTAGLPVWRKNVLKVSWGQVWLFWNKGAWFLSNCRLESVQEKNPALLLCFCALCGSPGQSQLVWTAEGTDALALEAWIQHALHSRIDATPKAERTFKRATVLLPVIKPKFAPTPNCFVPKCMSCKLACAKKQPIDVKEEEAIKEKKIFFIMTATCPVLFLKISLL